VIVTMNSERPAWLEQDSNLTKIVKVAAFGVIVVTLVYPFMAVLATSLASEADVIQNSGFVLWPEHPTLAAYHTVFAGGVVTRAIKVSVTITLIGTLLSLAVTIGMAYGLSRRVWGGRFFLMLALFTIFFTPGIIPSYLTVKAYGLLNNYAALILPVLINAFSVIVLRQFFMSIPGELVDSARIDGANDLQILTRIVLPLSRAVIAVIALFYAVGYWNNFFNALLYLNNSAMWAAAPGAAPARRRECARTQRRRRRLHPPDPAGLPFLAALFHAWRPQRSHQRLGESPNGSRQEFVAVLRQHRWIRVAECGQCSVAHHGKCGPRADSRRAVGSRTGERCHNRCHQLHRAPRSVVTESGTHRWLVGDQADEIPPLDGEIDHLAQQLFGRQTSSVLGDA
jgi:putative aldouronate transport system permease protein